MVRSRLYIMLNMLQKLQNIRFFDERNPVSTIRREGKDTYTSSAGITYVPGGRLCPNAGTPCITIPIITYIILITSTKLRYTQLYETLSQNISTFCQKLGRFNSTLQQSFQSVAGQKIVNVDCVPLTFCFFLFFSTRRELRGREQHRG